MLTFVGNAVKSIVVEYHVPVVQLAIFKHPAYDLPGDFSKLSAVMVVSQNSPSEKSHILGNFTLPLILPLSMFIDLSCI